MSINAPAVRQSAPPAAWTPTFAMTLDHAVEQVKTKREFFKRCMIEDTHYGSIPGTPKPSLWKPGAEFLLSSMGLHCEVSVVQSVRDYTGADHNGEAFVEFLCSAVVYRQIGPGRDDRMVIAQADGLCNSWEEKYRWRVAKRRCPDCDAEAIRENDEGFYCWRKIGGCGNTFQSGDDRISSQKLGLIPNPNIADLANTILKIAGKRAYIAASLLATGCSDIFTQDLSDDDDGGGDPGAGQENGGRRTGRTNGNGGVRNGGRTATGRAGSGGPADAQMAELRELNDQLGDRKWSPALLDGKAKGLGYEKVKAELEAQLGKAPDVTPPGDGGESAEGTLL